jgi:hypothetical protein
LSSRPSRFSEAGDFALAPPHASPQNVFGAANRPPRSAPNAPALHQTRCRCPIPPFLLSLRGNLRTPSNCLAQAGAEARRAAAEGNEPCRSRNLPARLYASWRARRPIGPNWGFGHLSAASLRPVWTGGSPCFSGPSEDFSCALDAYWYLWVAPCRSLTLPPMIPLRSVAADRSRCRRL